jgi:uncharacterized membrane protein
MTETPSSACALCDPGPGGGDPRPLSSLGPAIAALIRADHPDLAADAPICRRHRAHYRGRHIGDLLAAERGALTALDREVLDSIAAEVTVAVPPDAPEPPRSFGDRASDRMAAFGGTWRFLALFAAVLAVWMAVNSALVLGGGAFDPYPFILLNLVLSCLAAVQAPVIMMSQRRTEARDRARAESDYKVNLKAELEIRALHDRLDRQILLQSERLAAIETLLIEVLDSERAAAEEA